MAKWVHRVRSPAELAGAFGAAFHHATTGRPGPVVLDVLPGFFRAAGVDGPAVGRASTPAPDAAGVEAAAALLAAAARPLVVVGNGAGRFTSLAGLRRLADELRIPVFGNGLGRGSVPEDLTVGFPWPLAQTAAAEADAVLVAGARIGPKLSFGRPPRFSAAARFVHVDIDPGALAGGRSVDVVLAAEGGAAIDAIAERLADLHPAPWPEPAWVHGAVASRRGLMEQLAADGGGLVHPAHLAAEVAAAMPADAIVVGDGADILNFLLGVVLVQRPSSYSDHQPLGAMGVGTPLAIGAAAAAAEDARRTGGRARRVVLVTGDGAFGFFPFELDAAVRAGLDVTVVVSNNGEWGTERHAQVAAIGRAVNVALGDVRHDLVAAGLACRPERVERPADLAGALQRAFSTAGPSVVDVLTDPEAGAIRKRDERAQMNFVSDVAGGR